MLLFNGLIEASAGIVCIAQTTLVVVNKALLVNDGLSPDKCTLCDATLSGIRANTSISTMPRNTKDRLQSGITLRATWNTPKSHISLF